MPKKAKQNDLHPENIVKKLDQFIIGQDAAKKAVAIAIRNRWRRLQTGDMQHDIQPKNILMIGPTGVGKTEIARRIAGIIDAPFIKIEATKFTEVGYVGRDVDSIIRDLLNIAIHNMKEKAYKASEKQATKNVESIIIKQLEEKNQHSETTPPLLIEKYRQGQLDDQLIEIESNTNIGIEIITPPGMEDITNQLTNWVKNIPNENNTTKKMTVKEAKKILMKSECQSLINEAQIKQEAIKNAEENGIVFIDEIDKVVKSSGQSEVSREGVQRDLLPLIEGTTVLTQHGAVNTEHILFIASGSFMGVSPNDMTAELQGRLPVRVYLNALSNKNLKNILTQPQTALTKQYQALMKTENITLNFTPSGIEQLAQLAHAYNENNDNIGARQLHAVMEKCLGEVSYHAQRYHGKIVTVDKKFVLNAIPYTQEQKDKLLNGIL